MELTEKLLSYIRPSLKSRIRHIVPSAVCSQDDDTGCNDFLIELALPAISLAHRDTLDELEYRNEALNDSVYYNVFPGEHYRLLKAVTKVMGAKNIVEIGTYTGMGSASILEGMAQDSRLVTFDVIPWNSLDTHLRQSDFESGKITQHLCDLSMPDGFEEHRGLFNHADLIFCDAPKDGVFEYRFLELLSKNLTLPKKRLLILDDIRFLNMIDLWRSIKSPKLDLTSFGHWSGTGLVDISLGLNLQ